MLFPILKICASYGEQNKQINKIYLWRWDIRLLIVCVAVWGINLVRCRVLGLVSTVTSLPPVGSAFPLFMVSEVFFSVFLPILSFQLSLHACTMKGLSLWFCPAPAVDCCAYYQRKDYGGCRAVLCSLWPAWDYVSKPLGWWFLSDSSPFPWQPHSPWSSQESIFYTSPSSSTPLFVLV